MKTIMITKESKNNGFMVSIIRNGKVEHVYRWFDRSMLQHLIDFYKPDEIKEAE